MAEVEELRHQLEAVAEALADLALDRLRESVEGANSEAAQDERRLTRARRAVERAVATLRGGPEDEE